MLKVGPNQVITLTEEKSVDTDEFLNKTPAALFKECAGTRWRRLDSIAG